MDRRQRLRNHACRVCGSGLCYYAGGRVRVGCSLRIVNTWQPVGDDLRCRLRGDLGGSFVGSLGSGLCLSLLLGGSPPLGEILLSQPRQIRLSASDDENLLQLEEICGGLDLNQGVWLMVGVQNDGFDRPDWQAARINLIAA